MLKLISLQTRAYRLRRPIPNLCPVPEYPRRSLQRRRINRGKNSSQKLPRFALGNGKLHPLPSNMSPWTKRRMQRKTVHYLRLTTINLANPMLAQRSISVATCLSCNSTKSNRRSGTSLSSNRQYNLPSLQYISASATVFVIGVNRGMIFTE